MAGRVNLGKMKKKNEKKLLCDLHFFRIFPAMIAQLLSFTHLNVVVVVEFTLGISVFLIYFLSTF